MGGYERELGEGGIMTPDMLHQLQEKADRERVHGRRYRKKPVVITAVQFDPICAHVYDLPEGVKGSPETGDHWGDMGNEFWIDTLEGRMKVVKGDWIIKGVGGEFYHCKPDIFEATYEAVE